MDDLANHIVENIKLYQQPLTTPNNSLSYTSRFAETIVNLPGLDSDIKKEAFVNIKKSIMAEHTLSPDSCTALCDSLINFTFEGNEGQVLEKIREYATKHWYWFSSQQADHINRTYKVIMTDKAQGTVPFKAFKLNKVIGRTRELKQRIPNILKANDVKQFTLKTNINTEV